MQLPISSNHPTLVITLVRSPIGRPFRQRVILQGLGLRRLRQSVQRPNTQQVRGLIEKVSHLLEVNPL